MFPYNGPRRRYEAEEISLPEWMLAPPPIPGNVPPPPPARAQRPQSFGGAMERIGQGFELSPIVERPGRALQQMMRPHVPDYTGGTPFSGLLEPDPLGGPDVVRSAIDLFNPRRSFDERAGAAAQIAVGGLQLAAPLAGPFIARAPARALGALLYGGAAQEGTREISKLLHLGPGTTDLLSTAAGLRVGTRAAKVPFERALPALRDPRMAREFLAGEEGEITYGPSRGWTSTLLDLIARKNVPKFRSRELHQIAAQHNVTPGEVLWTKFGDLLTVGQIDPKEVERTRADVLAHLDPVPLWEQRRTEGDVWFKENYTLPGGEGYEELNMILPPEHYGHLYKGPSAHWEGLINPVAHSRYDIRTGPEGIRSLHVHEGQSDLHNKGLGIGYRTPAPPEFQPLIASDAAVRTSRDRYQKAVSAWEARPTGFTDRAVLERLRLDRERDQAYDAYNAARQADWTARAQAGYAVEHDFDQWRVKPGAAPFEHEYHKLILKRMLAEAVSRGLHRLTWSTAGQNGMLESQGQFVKSLTYDPLRETLRGFGDNTPALYPAHIEYNVTPEKLAQRIENDEVAKYLREQAEDHKKEMQKPEDYRVEKGSMGNYRVIDPFGNVTAQDQWGSYFQAEGQARSFAQSEADNWNNQLPIPQVAYVDTFLGSKTFNFYKQNYNQKWPQFLREYGKKYGVKVRRDMVINGEPGGENYTVWGVDIPDDLWLAIKRKGLPKFGQKEPTEENIKQFDFFDILGKVK